MDGVQQMSSSMTSYLSNMFGIVTNACTNSSDSKQESGLSPNHDSESSLLSLFDPNIETILIEPQYEASEIPQGDGLLSTSSWQESVSFSLILKKKNQRKSNSQMWWIGSHAAACQGEYLLTTDCGIHFPPVSLQRMVTRLDQDKCLAAITGRKNIMSASMQGDDPHEIFSDPTGYALRQIQTMGCEQEYVMWKMVFDSIGFEPCLDGPCSFFRSTSFGTLNKGVAGQYFRLMNQEAKDLIFGNVKLVEDRIASTLLVFRHTRSEGMNLGNQTTNKTPSFTTIEKASQEAYLRTGSVHDAIFNYDAEKTLRQFVAQRRRWLNGAFAMYLWILKEGYIWQGYQLFRVKLIAFLFCTLNLIQMGYLRLAGPAMVAILMYNLILAIPVLAATNSSKETSAFMITETRSFTSEPANVSASIFTIMYLVFYVVFMICHTPKAVPIKDKNGNPTKHWRNDCSSAYRPVLFFLSVAISVLQMCLTIVVLSLIYAKLGWKATPLVVRLTFFALLAPYILAIFDGIFNSTRPNLNSFVHMIKAAPVAVLMSIWFGIWLPSYASARVSDLSWGNRDTSDGESSAAIAKVRARTGRLITATVVLSNIVVFVFFFTLCHTAKKAFIVILNFNLVIWSIGYFFAFVDVAYRRVKGATAVLHRLGGISNLSKVVSFFKEKFTSMKN